MTQLSPTHPEIIARAIVAACKVYGDDPEAAVTTSSGWKRRSLNCAVFGIATAANVYPTVVMTALKMGKSSAYQAKQNATDIWWQASRAAELAVAPYVTWKPAQEPPAPPAAAGPPKRPLSAPRPHSAAAAALLKARGAAKAADFCGVAKFNQAPVAFKRPLPKSPISIGDRIMAELSNKPLAAPTLATLLGEKENIISQALSALVHERQAEPGEVPPNGERYRVYRPLEGA